MRKTKQTADTDIAEQRYRGPSVASAAAGESVLHGKFLLLTGILLGGIAGAVFPTKTAEFTKAGREALGKWKESENHFLHGAGSLGNWLLGMGEGFVAWVRGIKTIDGGLLKLEKNDPYKRVSTAIGGAIMASSALSTIGFITGIFSGSRASHRGKKQFETAKDEIITLRETNEKLRSKLIDTELALDDLKTAADAKHGKLHVTPDDHARTTPSAHISTDGATTSRALDLTSDIALG
jgi:hypothetical protein